MKTVSFTPVVDAGMPLVMRKPDVWDDGDPGFVRMTWAYPTRQMVEDVWAVASKEVLQVRNRDGFLRVVVSPGAVLMKMETDEAFRLGGSRVIEATGVLQVAAANVNRGVDQLSLLFWYADDMFESATGVVTRVNPLPPPEPEPVPE